jgi:ADP-heptose:LPS heptosyltransferase
MAATGVKTALGSVNTFPDSRWNQLSDALYTDLFRPDNPFIHDFSFNALFAEWSCGASYPGKRPQITYPFKRPFADPYLLCFIGSNTRSKRWPVKRWIEFINLYQKYYSNRVILSGGKNEEEMAKAIREATGAESIVGNVSLHEMIDWISGAHAVITNDTMAAHLSAACNRPAVIIANGNNHIRFTEYGNAGIDNVATIYPEIFHRWRRRVGDSSLHYTAVSADIVSISATAVLNELEEILQLNEMIEFPPLQDPSEIGAFKMPVTVR